jgi:hypothetical protein
MINEAAKKQVAAIQASAHTFKQSAKPIQDNTHPRVISVIDKLFLQLKAITAVGNAFKTPQEEHIVKQEWILAFAEEGIRGQDVIDVGVEMVRIKARKSRGTTWFPSIGEFIDMCLGSDNKIEFAERAYNLFIKREQQIDTVGRMVTASHSFELRQMKAADCKKGFIELYLKYAENNPIEQLEAFALTETVQLSPEQQKEADKRAQAAQSEFLAKFSGIAAEKPKEPVKKVKPGLKAGKIQGETRQSLAAAEKERERQLRKAGLL